MMIRVSIPFDRMEIPCHFDWIEHCQLLDWSFKTFVNRSANRAIHFAALKKIICIVLLRTLE
jgi:hypothetical protein